MVGIFGRVDVWQVAKLKVVSKTSLANRWHKDTSYKLTFGCSSFGESSHGRRFAKFPNIPGPLYSV